MHLARWMYCICLSFAAWMQEMAGGISSSVTDAAANRVSLIAGGGVLLRPLGFSLAQSRFLLVCALRSMAVGRIVRNSP